MRIQDRIIALFPDLEHADDARLALFTSGIATDRLDVVSWQERGRSADVPATDRALAFQQYFDLLLEGCSDAPHSVSMLVAAMRAGKACLVVHPRGMLEVTDVRRILDARHPETQLEYVLPPERQGGLFGEHAAG